FSTFLFQFYSTVADHYLYVAMLGPALVLAWMLRRFDIVPIRAAAVAWLIALAAQTFLQTAAWKDDLSLFGRAIAVNDNSFLAHNNLGDIYLNAGQPDLAAPQLLAAHKAKPDYIPAIENL